MNHIEKQADDYANNKYGDKTLFPEVADIWDDGKADFKAGYQQAVNDIIGCQSASANELHKKAAKAMAMTGQLAYKSAAEALQAANKEITERFKI